MADCERNPAMQTRSMMEFLNSAWLLRMIEQAGPQPMTKLLAVYTLAETWLQAPGVRQGMHTELASAASALLNADTPELRAHLLALATAAKLQQPVIVVNQLLMLLQGGLAEEMRNPGQQALSAAQQAAKVVLHQARPSLLMRADKAIRSSGYAAAFMMLTVLTLHIWPGQSLSSFKDQAGQDVSDSPDQVADIEPALLLKAFALRKSLESGTCPSPNFFSMPKEQVAVYMDVVNSRLSNNPTMNNQRLANFLGWYEQQRAWECYPSSQIKQRFISRI